MTYLRPAEGGFTLSVHARAVVLRSGDTGRKKVFFVAGVSVDAAAELLKGQL